MFLRVRLLSSALICPELFFLQMLLLVHWFHSFSLSERHRDRWSQRHAATNTGRQIPDANIHIQSLLPILLGRDPKVESLDRMVILFYDFPSDGRNFCYVTARGRPGKWSEKQTRGSYVDLLNQKPRLRSSGLCSNQPCR